MIEALNWKKMWRIICEAIRVESIPKKEHLLLALNIKYEKKQANRFMDPSVSSQLLKKIGLAGIHTPCCIQCAFYGFLHDWL